MSGAEDKIHGSLATLTIKLASGISENEIKDRVNETLAAILFNTGWL